MAVNIQDRPVETVREEVIDLLIVNYSNGKLSYEAFERRLDKAMESTCNIEITKLAEDLEEVVDKEYLQQKERDFGVNYASCKAPESDKLINIFGGSNRTGRWTVAKEMSSLSVFGGSKIDFSEAEFSSPEITFKTFALFGGDDIYVPEGVNVVTKAFCIFGGIDNKTYSHSSRHAPTIVIEGVVIFGGVSIKVKKTVKEKFVSFADSLKNMFG